MTNNHPMYEHCQIFLDMIQPWQGRPVALWYYTVSLQQLHLRLGEDSAPVSEMIYLLCAGCDHICAPSRWPSCQIEITPNLESIRPRTSPALIVVDREANLHVTCAMLSVLTHERYYEQSHHGIQQVAARHRHAQTGIGTAPHQDATARRTLDRSGQRDQPCCLESPELADSARIRLARSTPFG